MTDTVIYFSDQHLTWLSELKPNAKGKYQAEVSHLSHAYILLILGLFEMLIANMMLICGANNIKIHIT